LLQFVWQFRYFNKSQLLTTTGEDIQIIYPGHHNHNQGPDFLDAKIRIGNTLWAGTVELHLQSSGWEKHRHHTDKNYNNVVLHVVWEHDLADMSMPVLELKNRVPKILLQRYEQLIHSSSFIPCEKSIGLVKDITWKAWKDRLLAERLLRKKAVVEEYLLQNNHHWEETFWWLLARNFGIKVNADAFEAVARSIPLKILARHKDQLHQLEALLFGQAGLLNNDFEEDYPRLLQREYRFMQKKNKLQPIHLPIHFLRMRPGNFPTVRLAQLAMLIHKAAHLFSFIKESNSLKEIRNRFNIAANDYWHYHYRFDELSSLKIKKQGVSMIDNIIINTIAPALFAYGHYHKENKYKEKAIQWMEETNAENNAVTNGFAQLGKENRTACDSQAMLELKNEYCNKKRCLDCAIGNAILNRQ
jgi:hypothetical protein